MSMNNELIKYHSGKQLGQRKGCNVTVKGGSANLAAESGKGLFVNAGCSSFVFKLQESPGCKCEGVEKSRFPGVTTS